MSLSENWIIHVGSWAKACSLVLILVWVLLEREKQHPQLTAEIVLTLLMDIRLDITNP